MKKKIKGQLAGGLMPKKKIMESECFIISSVRIHSSKRFKREWEYPYIVWDNHGYEGWNPVGFDSLKAAIDYDAYGNTKVITKNLISWKKKVR